MFDRLMGYQMTGARHLASRRKALLADDMGLGKTVQAIAACKLVGARRVVVLCPASLVAQWRAEFASWWPDDAPELSVQSYDMHRRRLGSDLPGTFDVLVLDESHQLKSPGSQRTQAVYGHRGVGGTARRARRVWCLTGTPAPNNASELWTTLFHLAPETIPDGTGSGPLDFYRFKRKYCVLKNNGFGERIVGSRNQRQLRESIDLFLLRRMKKDVLTELPPLLFGTIHVEDKAAANALANRADLALLQEALSEGPGALAGVAATMAGLRRITATAKAPYLSEWAENWLSACNRKLVLFGIHRDPLKMLSTDLAHHAPAVVTGEVEPLKRAQEVSRFQLDPKCRVFIGQITAAGTGLTLTAASDLVFLEQSWTPADNLQAAMRIHRLGQTAPCSVNVVSLVDSLDAHVQRALAKKTADLAELGLMEADNGHV